MFPPVGGLRALGLPSSPPVHSQSLTAYLPTFPPLDSAPAVFCPPQSQSPPPVLPHDWTTRCPPRARPSSPFDDLRTVLFRSSPRRAPPVSVPLPPPSSSLTVSSHPITDYYRAARPVVSCVLTSLVTDPRASPSSVSALTAALVNFAATCRLEFATRVGDAPPTRPLFAGGEFAFGCDVLKDRQFELEFLAAASPSLCAMLLSPDGDPDVRGPLSEGLGFESQCVQFGHPSAGGCQRSTGHPRLIIGKGYRLVVLGGYGRTDPLLNKPFYPNGLMVGILTPDALDIPTPRMYREAVSG
ncbi:unnamed protein product [Closterium sp. NIES-53]